MGVVWSGYGSELSRPARRAVGWRFGSLLSWYTFFEIVGGGRMDLFRWGGTGCRVGLCLVAFRSSLGEVRSMCSYRGSLFIRVRGFFALRLMPCARTTDVPTSTCQVTFVTSNKMRGVIARRFRLLPCPVRLLASKRRGSLTTSLRVTA